MIKENLTKIGELLEGKDKAPWWIIDDYIGLLRECHSKLMKMKPKKSCQHCRFYKLDATCEKAGKAIPDEIRAKGCEAFEDVIKDLMI